MLIIEIILTIFAWRKGWKWLSLIPVGAALLLGLLIGFSVGSSGGSVESVNGFAFFLDLLVIIALIVMNVKDPKTKSEELTTDEKE